MSGIKLPDDKIEKIQNYVISRTKSGHREESSTGKQKEQSAMTPAMKSMYEKIVASTGSEFTEELALAVKNEGLVYKCLMALVGRGNFRYEKSDIKSKKGGGFSVEFKSPASSEMSSILSKGGKGSMFKLEHNGKSYEAADIAGLKAKMGKGGTKKAATKKAAAKPATKKAAAKPAAKAPAKKTPAKKPATKKAAKKK